MPSDGKSSLCLWQGELKKRKSADQRKTFVSEYRNDIAMATNQDYCLKY
jgi:hypothetical protein